MCMWDPRIHEKIRDHTFMRSADRESENEMYMARMR